MELDKNRYFWPMDWFWRYLNELSEIELPGRTKSSLPFEQNCEAAEEMIRRRAKREKRTA